MNVEKIREIINKFYRKFQIIIDFKYIPVIVTIISISIFAIGQFLNLYNVALVGVFIFWIYSILYGISNIKKRFMFLIMNMMIFTFILSRPIISFFRGDIWWYFSDSTIWKALVSIFVTEIFMFIGNIVLDKIDIKLNNNENNENKTICINKNFKKEISKILLIIIIITGLVSAYIEVYKYISMKDVAYELNYTMQVKKFSILTRILSTMFPYAVFAYLATMPKKKSTIAILLLYIILAIPSFMLGSRNTLMLRALFAVVYIAIRSVTFQTKEIWITTKTKIVLIILIPIIIMGLGAYNYIRSNDEIITYSPIGLIVDFFYKQGTSFDTICQGFEYENQLKNQENVISYTFGDIIDYLLHNTISQKIFGTKDLGSGNSMIMVTDSNSMAHRLSYLVFGEEVYLSGHGRGTSYILETYMDGGIIWLSIYSLMLGMFLANISKILKNGNFIIRYIILTAISQIFLLPRYSASGFISFIVTPQFWIIALLIMCIKHIIQFIEKKKQGERNE